jgi:hypothetical protein
MKSKADMMKNLLKRQDFIVMIAFMQLVDIKGGDDDRG